MLFNSAGFLFVFLPLVLTGFAFALRAQFLALAVWGLLIASYVFYGWWDPQLIALLSGSTAMNFVFGSLIVHFKMLKRALGARVLLWMGIIGNLGLLAYFKYAGFLAANIEAVTGAHFSFAAIALPAGISFYTFTQIAFLVDASRDAENTAVRPAQYFLFVSYFPHLIAGPIIHHKATIPQFGEMTRRGLDPHLLAVGLSIFAIGLFKKIAIADFMAPLADSSFSVAVKEAPSMLISWVGALAYTFQIYFDFSGYSDMAIGLSLLFGIRLPLNFASPYKATSIIEFWTRWHISLSQFLRNYLYIPLGGNRRGTVRRYANLMITMLLGGLWHGAAWTFVIWGGLHGTLIAANHLLRLHYKPSPTPTAAIVWTKRIAVFLAVTVAWVFFRADSLGSAINMLAGLSGAGGIGQVAPLSLVYLAACLFIAWILPNTNQIFERSMPTLPPNPDAGRPAPRMLLWAPNLAWAVAAGGALAGCALAMNQASPFLYFRF